jgi:hypothetical protein
MSVIQQQVTANLVLDKLYPICPYTIVAGGAPRDWYFGNEAKDIDVYFSTTALTESMLMAQLKAAFGNDMEVKFSRRTDLHKDPIYKTLVGLIRIIELTINNTKVQLIQMDSSERLFKVVDDFSVSICKIWYKGGTIFRTKDFKLTEKTKVMFLSDGYKWNDPHPAKIASRFTDYKAGTRQAAVAEMENAFLND